MQAAPAPVPPARPVPADEVPIPLVLRGEHITLDALLKCVGLASSGGAAKAMIGAGLVEVDGRSEARRGRKLRAGQRVRVGEVQIRVLAATQADQGNLTGLADPTDPANPGAAASESLESSSADRGAPAPSIKP